MIEAYRPENHFQMISSWFKKRDLFAVTEDLLPKIGFVVPQIAAGFLYQTDSGVSFIENLIANPGSEKNIRDQALDEIVDKILQRAGELQFKIVLGFTELKSVKERAKRHGFVVGLNPYTFLAKGV